MAAGFGIFSGNVAARTVGVIVAIISAVINFMWLPYYPVWAVIVIAIDIAVVWALTAHGRDLAKEAAGALDHRARLPRSSDRGAGR